MSAFRIRQYCVFWMKSIDNDGKSWYFYTNRLKKWILSFPRIIRESNVSENDEFNIISITADATAGSMIFIIISWILFIFLN